MNNFTKLLTRLRRRSADDPIVHRLSLGEQDAMDIVSYSGLEEQANHVIIDGQYVRVLSISGYPFNAELGWLDSLINFHRSADIVFHVEQVDSNDALRKLKRKIGELETTRREAIKSGKVVGPDIEDPLESALDLRAGIYRGQQKLFQVSIYAALITDSLKELNEVTRSLESSLSARLFQTRVATHRQLDGLQSVLTRAEDLLGNKRNLDSSTAALTFPFVSSELVQESGILYGVNQSNNSLVILDRFLLHNANGIVFAQSGSGKSYAMKVEILRQLTQGTKVIVIDPEREYENLTRSVKGTYIKLSAKSEQKINPFDLASTSHSKEALAEHIQDLTQVISLMVGGLAESEKAGVDKAILAVYAKSKKKPPLLNDFYAELYSLGHHKLCERLEKYTKGSLTDILDAHTNIDLENRLVVFDIKDLPESLRQIMMMIIANFVQNTVKAKPEKRLLVIDEGWLLLEHEESARFVAGLVRRARKYYLGVTIISQQANDFLSNKYGKAIASQSAFRMLMRHDTTTIDEVMRQFNLSDYERRYLSTCDRGEALLIADQNHVSVRIMASEEEHPLITTDPSETLGV